MSYGTGMGPALRIDGCAMRVGTWSPRGWKPRYEIVDRIDEAFDRRWPSKFGKLAVGDDAGAQLSEGELRRTIRPRQYEDCTLDRMGSIWLMQAHIGGIRSPPPRFPMET